MCVRCTARGCCGIQMWPLSWFWRLRTTDFRSYRCGTFGLPRHLSKSWRATPGRDAHKPCPMQLIHSLQISTSTLFSLFQRDSVHLVESSRFRAPAEQRQRQPDPVLEPKHRRGASVTRLHSNDLYCIQSTYDQFMHSLRIKRMTLMLLASCSTVTGLSFIGFMCFKRIQIVNKKTQP